MELAAAKKKKGPSFMLPNQVKNVGNKIRNLFFRHQRENTIQAQPAESMSGEYEDQSQQIVQVGHATQRKTQGGKDSNNAFKHYNDYDY